MPGWRQPRRPEIQAGAASPAPGREAQQQAGQAAPQWRDAKSSAAAVQHDAGARPPNEVVNQLIDCYSDQDGGYLDQIVHPFTEGLIR
jgi:hypothetical protein